MAAKLTHAGCVVFRREAGRVSYLLVSSSDGTEWVLPKGHIEYGRNETPWAAAARELREEAGLECRRVADLSVRRFSTPDGSDVVVQYFLVEEAGRADSHEGRSLRWVDESDLSQVQLIGDIRDVLMEAASVRREREEGQ
jgi:8-oxo-dGTP pyrophosphatase MutT (NUDIX family)